MTCLTQHLAKPSINAVNWAVCFATIQPNSWVGSDQTDANRTEVLLLESPAVFSSVKGENFNILFCFSTWMSFSASKTFKKIGMLITHI